MVVVVVMVVVVMIVMLAIVITLTISIDHAVETSRVHVMWCDDDHKKT